MARSATSENIARDEGGPDFQGAINLIRGKIRTNQSDSRSLAQDNSTLFKRIDKQMGVHPAAAKDFGKIDGMAPEKRTDYLRSLLGLLSFAEYDNFDDLVDRAQKPSGKKEGKAKAKEPAADKPAAAPDALDGNEQPSDTVDLRTGMIVDPQGNDVREATPEELAEARERQADFADALAENVHAFPRKAN